MNPRSLQKNLTIIALIVASLAGLAMTFSILSRPLHRDSRAASCSCSPPPEQFNGWTDNFCFHPPGTTDCPMTHPGGYCDPNGDASYEDGDWNRGFTEYKAQCGAATPTTAPTTAPTTVPGDTPIPTVLPGSSPTPTSAPGTTPPPGTTPTPTVPAATSTPMPSPTPVPELCKIIHGSDLNQNEKYDLIFIPSGYADAETFIADAKTATDIIRGSNLDRLKNKFNLIANTDIYKTYDVEANLTWDTVKAKQTMNACSGDGYMIIVFTRKPYNPNGSRNPEGDVYTAYGSAGLGNGQAIVLRSGLDISLKMLGISVAGVYPEDPLFGANAPTNIEPPRNCTRDSSCSGWNNIPGAGCFKNCGYLNLYRSTFKSYMWNYPYDNDGRSYNTLTLDSFMFKLDGFSY